MLNLGSFQAHPGSADTFILCFTRQNSSRCPKLNSLKYSFVEVSGHNLENSQTWGFHVQCLHNKPVSNHFWPGVGGGGWGVKSISSGDCEYQGRKLLRLFSQVRPRIPPLFWSGVCRTVGWTLDLPLYIYSLPRWSQVTCHRGGGGGWGCSAMKNLHAAV